MGPLLFSSYTSVLTAFTARGGYQLYADDTQIVYHFSINGVDCIKYKKHTCIRHGYVVFDHITKFYFQTKNLRHFLLSTALVVILCNYKFQLKAMRTFIIIQNSRHCVQRRSALGNWGNIRGGLIRARRLPAGAVNFKN